MASLLLAAAPLLGAAAALSDGTSSPDFVCLFAVPLTAGLLLPDGRAAVALVGLLSLGLGESLLWTGGAGLPTVLLRALALVAASLAASRVARAVRPGGPPAGRSPSRPVAKTASPPTGQGAHAERFALLGRFAAGVAHDISNPLTYLSSNLQLLEREADSLQEVSRRDVHAAAVESARAVDRITEVLRTLRRFARSEGVGAPQPAEVGPLVEEALQQTAPRLRGIQLERALDEPLPPVRVRRRRLVQVLGNLLLECGGCGGGAAGEGAAHPHWRPCRRGRRVRLGGGHRPRPQP